MAGDAERPRLFTLLGSGMSYSPEQLPRVSAPRLPEQLKADLRRAGSATARGFLFAALDGEYDPSTNLFRLHWHGMAAGGMVEVVTGLKRQRKYAPKGVSLSQDAVRNPVRLQHQPLTNLPKPLTYIIKGWWKNVDRGAEHAGNINPGRKHRIPEPAHSAYLSWLDRCRLQDLTLLVHLRVIDGRLMPR